MALSIVEVLAAHGSIDQDDLAARFAKRMTVGRGYGAGAYEILMGVRAGDSWRSLSRSGFGGMGSFGDGAAMRVAPLGAFFAQAPLDHLVRQAALSAEVTHAHPEGIAGAIAVAVAVADAWTRRSEPLGAPFLRRVLDSVPKGYTRDAIREALDVPGSADVVTAAKALGNGSGITAPDTVPLCLWVVAHHDDFVEAPSARSATEIRCAIVGGILAPRLGRERLPSDWLRSREPFVYEVDSGIIRVG